MTRRELSEGEERGLDVLGGLLGHEFSGSVRDRVARGGIGTDLTRLSLGTTFAQVWAREGLDRRGRSLVTIALLIAVRADPKELANHFRIGMGNGLTLQELEEVVIHVFPYLGHVAAGPAMEQLKIFAAGLEPKGG